MTDSFGLESNILDVLDMLNGLSKDVNKEVNKQTKITAFKTNSEAVKSISTQPSMGRVYGNHMASKAGDAPNTDTGNLVQSIKVKKGNTLGGLDEYFVGSALDYAAWLEFGTLTIAARPWLQLAVAKVADDHIDRITAAVRRATNNA